VGLPVNKSLVNKVAAPQTLGYGWGESSFFSFKRFNIVTPVGTGFLGLVDYAICN
jgi:hypothetical protein